MVKKKIKQWNTLWIPENRRGNVFSCQLCFYFYWDTFSLFSLFFAHLFTLRGVMMHCVWYNVMIQCVSKRISFNSISNKIPLRNVEVKSLLFFCKKSRYPMSWNFAEMMFIVNDGMETSKVNIYPISSFGDGEAVIFFFE